MCGLRWTRQENRKWRKKCRLQEKMEFIAVREQAWPVSLLSGRGDPVPPHLLPGDTTLPKRNIWDFRKIWNFLLAVYKCCLTVLPPSRVREERQI